MAVWRDNAKAIDGHKDIFICAFMLDEATVSNPGSTTAPPLSAEMALAQLRAIAEPTRLRIVFLLAHAELSVKELTQVLGQSQPRISRHLKLLAEAHVISRFREGAWVNIRLADPGSDGQAGAAIVDLLDPTDSLFQRDLARANALIAERARTAERYFVKHAADWDEIRSLHVDEARVEAAMLAALGKGPFRSLLDVGTGTGRILELFAGRYQRGLGLDSNPSMLAYARSRLEHAGLGEAQVRHGDLFNIDAPDQAFDAIVVHQVLHFLSDPARAIAEIARVLAANGRLLIVDFAPHDLAFLRERHAHHLLGIGSDDMASWLGRAGLAIENVATLEPTRAKRGHALTVTLWRVGRARSTNTARTETARTDASRTDAPFFSPPKSTSDDLDTQRGAPGAAEAATGNDLGKKDMIP
ncbi:MAG: metalloregulator ArsR/SmtB family transcription factor [Pseudomonadota bacterium]